MSEVFDTDATPTLRGFRNQFVYTLYRVITHVNTATRFLPESKEDLSIMNESNRITEIIQIKDYTGSLPLSSLKPSKNNSFLRRSLHELSIDPTVNIQLVSFGPISSTLKNQDLFEEKLIEHSFSKEEAQLLAKSIQMEEVDSSELERHISNFLNSTSAANDPLCAFKTLWAWIYTCAEQKRQISYKDVTEQLDRIGQFVSERAVHHQEWFKSILPIRDKVISNEDRELLSNAFYHGVSTQNEHILAGLDVIRKAKLEDIALKFESGARTVILHGASGQGKSTIAYRFFHEYFPDYWRFQIVAVENRQHALNIAAAIAGQARSVDIPLGIYLDVGPEDYSWTQVVKELSKYENIRLLVTIREEDLQRANISTTDLGLPGQIHLLLEKEEATEIFNALVDKGLVREFTTFEEAWSKFNGSGPLLEFVYLVTQGVLLEDRLNQQIQRLQDEKREYELSILSFVALASAYQARLHLGPLIEQLQIPATLRKRSLKQLENEYLIRVSDDQTLVSGLHPIRSQVLNKILFDDDMNSWLDNAKKCFHLIFESDIEIFLLSAFAYQERWIDDLLLVIYTTSFNTWRGIGGATRALHWLGIKRYIEENSKLIHEIYQKFKHAWWLHINIDFTDTIHQLPIIDNIIEKNRWSQEPTNKINAFKYIREYLSLQELIVPPVKELDWAALGEVLFWSGYLKIELPIKRVLIECDLTNSLSSLPIDVVAEMIFGISYCLNDFSQWINQYKMALLERFKAETDTIAIREEQKENEKILKIYYFIDFVDKETNQDGDLPTSNNRKSFMATPRLVLLQKIMPGYDRYASAGYGHLKIFEGMNYPDETVKGIPANMFPPKPLQMTNSVFIELANKKFRTDTLHKYAHEVSNLRKLLLQLLTALEHQLQFFFKKQLFNKKLLDLSQSEQWQICLSNLQNPPLLPNSVLDEWGFMKDPTYESSKAGSAKPSSKDFVNEQDIAIRVYAPFLKVYKDYCTHMSNFLLQAQEVIRIYYQVPNSNRTKIKPNNDFNTNQHLSSYNLTQVLLLLAQTQQEYKKLFKRFFIDNSIEWLEDEERRIFNNVWHIWCYFATTPNVLLNNATTEIKKKLEALRRRAQLSIQSQIQGNEDIQLVKIVEGIVWQDHSTLTVVVDCSIVKQEEIVQKVRIIIKKVTEAMTTTNLKRYILDRFWHYFIIVPLYQNKSYNSKCYRFHWTTFDEVGLGDIGSLPQEKCAEIKIEQWNLADLHAIEKFFTLPSSLLIYLKHLQDFKRLDLNDITDQENAIVQQYTSKLTAPLSNQLDAYVLSASTAMPVITSIGRDFGEDAKALAKLADIFSTVYPNTLDENNQRVLSIDEIDRWASDLETSCHQLTLLHRLAIAFIVFRHEHLSNTDH